MLEDRLDTHLDTKMNSPLSILSDHTFESATNGYSDERQYI